MASLRTIATARGPIEVASVWQGAPVLLLHGGMGGQDQGLILASALGLTGCHVLSVSRPGYLGTPLSSGVSPEAQADLYAALLDALAIPRVLVVAVSAGGVSALQFAARHPERTRALVLVSAATGALPAPAGYKQRLALLSLLARLPAFGAFQAWRRRRDPNKAAARSIPDAALRARTLAHPVAGPLLRSFQTVTFRKLAQRLPGTITDIETLAGLPRLPIAVPDVPMLAIHGTVDTVAPYTQARALADASSRLELAPIEGGEHLCLFTHLDAIRSTLRPFLARHPA